MEQKNQYKLVSFRENYDGNKGCLVGIKKYNSTMTFYTELNNVKSIFNKFSEKDRSIVEYISQKAGRI